MNNGIFNTSFIKGVSVTVPSHRIDMRDFHFDGVDNEEVIKFTGVHQARRAVEGETQLDYCLDAAKRLMNEMDFDKSKIDGVVFATPWGDYPTPGNAYLTQNLLDLPVECFLVDINQACAGFVNGFFQASMLIQTGYCKNVLVCAGDTATGINDKDKSLQMLLGDAGAAAIVSKKEGASDTAFAFYNDGRVFKALYVPSGGKRRDSKKHLEDFKEETVDKDGNTRRLVDSHMDGLEVMAFAMDAVPDAINRVLKTMDWKKQDVDLYALHQANEIMLKTLIKRCRIPAEKVPLTLKNFGNTAGASIPLDLVLCAKNREKEGNWDKVVMCGFGNGLACAAAALSLKDTYFSEIHDFDGVVG